MTTAKIIVCKVFVLVALLLLVTTAVPDLAAAAGLKLIASEESVESANIVTVTITAENAAGSEGGQFYLNYDPALVKPVSSKTGELVSDARSGMYMDNLNYDTGQIKVMWITAAADTADEGTICTITFELLEEGETALEFDEIIVAPEDLGTATAVPGKITIGDVGVDQEPGEQTDQESEEEITEEVDPSAEEDITETEQENGSFSWITVLVILVVLAAAGFVIFKRQKKPGAKHVKRKK